MRGVPSRSGPLSWSPAERCLLVGLVCAIFFAGFWLLGSIAASRDSIAPYYDWTFFRLFQRGVLAGVGLWLVLVAVAYSVRRRHPESRVLVHVTVQLYSLSTAIGTLCLGPVTSPFGIAILGGAVLGLFLFPRRVVFLGVATAMIVLGAGAVAARSGRMPYAPLLSRPPYEAGVVSGWWYLMMSITVVSVGAAVLGMFAYVVGRLRAHEARLVELAETDILTGLPNRRCFLEVFERELQRAFRHGAAAACFVIDLDHFKRVNDEHGHLVGDRVLQAAAKVLGAGLRTNDVLARWGGEEFVLLLPDTTEEGARAAGERARKRLEQTAIPVGADGTDGAHGRTLQVTASFGLACLPDSRVTRADDLLKLADLALYQAKAGGRNRLAMAPAGALGETAGDTGVAKV